MLIKNNNTTIYDCLESIKNIITSYYITDIGSTDNTIDIIKKWSDENNINGKIVKRNFKNIGYNKTENFKEAKEYLKDTDKTTYVLFFDPFVKIKSESLPKLKEKAYKIKSNLEYDDIKLAKIKYNWKCIGTVYEYWKETDYDDKDYDTDYDTDYKFLENTEMIYMNNDVDYENLLKIGMILEPNNGRYIYYLAKLYNKKNDIYTIDLYKKRIEIKQEIISDELYNSYINIVKLYLKKENFIEASEWALQLYYRFNKIEAYIFICEFLQEKGYNYLCYFYIDKMNHLKIDKFDELKIIIGKSLNKIKESYDLCELMLKKKEYMNKDLIVEYEILYLPTINIKQIDKINIICDHLLILNKYDYIYILKYIIYYSDGNILIDLNEYKRNGDKISSIHYIDNDNIIINIINNNNYKHLRININTKYISEHENSLLPLLTKKSKLFVNTNNPFSILNERGSIVNLRLYNQLHKCGPKTNGIEYKNGLLILLYIYDDKNKKIYYRLFWISNNFSERKYSKAFYFINKLNEDIQCIIKEKDIVIFIHRDINHIYNKLYINDSEIDKFLSEKI
jgi:hypothetical protein